MTQRGPNGGKESESPQRRNVLAQMGAEDRATRYAALQQLGDFLECESWTTAEAGTVAAALIVMASEESNAELLEQILNDLLNIARVANFPPSLDPIADLAGRPGFPEPLIGYCLLLLTYSRHQAFRPVLKRFLSHPRQGVRQEAAEALAELDGVANDW